MQDFGYNLTNPRRRSNSSSTTQRDFKTKFETVEPEPVFEEELHGPDSADLGHDVDKLSTGTGASGSVDEDEAAPAAPAKEV